MRIYHWFHREGLDGDASHPLGQMDPIPAEWWTRRVRAGPVTATTAPPPSRNQRALHAVQDQPVQSEQAVAANLIALYEALGGGWEPAPQPQGY